MHLFGRRSQNCFCGKELQYSTYRHITRKLGGSGYYLDQLENILHDEVTPINLVVLAIRENEGWSDEFVENQIREKLRAKPTLLEKLVPQTSLFKCV